MPPQVAQNWAEFRNQLRILFWGCVWAACAALGPVLLIFFDMLHNYEEIDWQLIQRTGVGSALTGAVMYCLKHRALLKLPPWFKDVPLDTSAGTIQATIGKEGAI